ncbi:MAG: amidohydrolase family protein [Candidatus Bathyarchaeia archaeon]
MLDAVIKNSKIFTPFGIFEGGLGIENGKIVTITKDSLLPPADLSIDAKKALAIPGVIDAHVHVHTGIPNRDTFQTGSIAAIAGGITFIIDFVSRDNGTLKNAFEKKKNIGEEYSSIDFSLHVNIYKKEHLDEIEELANYGVASFKHMMANCDGTPWVPITFMLESFEKIKNVEGICSVHAESEELRNYFMEKLKKEGKNDPIAHANSRPDLCEIEAILKAILIAEYTNARLHIFHLASGKALEFIKAKKNNGITVETCPQYLIFNKEDLKKYGPYLQVNPSLKSKEDRKALWDGLADGTIDIVTSDHYAPLKSEKEIGWKNAWEVEGGVPGVETTLMLLLSEGVNKNRISLERLIDAVCTKPAKIYGIYPRKGVIQLGSDADIVLIDMKKEFKIKADKLHHKADWTPYEGIKVKGLPVLTIVKGEVLMKDREVWDKPKHGKFIKCHQIISLK